VVTSLIEQDHDARALYEDVYCARGESGAATMRASQLRLWFASMAYVVLDALRRIGLAGGRFADAACGTIHLKLLKIGALAPQRAPARGRHGIGLTLSARIPRAYVLIGAALR
jgi:hypothetical protein